MWLNKDGDSDYVDDDVDNDNSGASGGGRNLNLKGVYNLTLVKVNVFVIAIFETPDFWLTN